MSPKDFSPYFDDFNSENNFYQILFTPGRPVQTRELNQIQSIFQNQIGSFANHMFKNGSMIIPGHTFFDNKVVALKVKASINGIVADNVLSLVKDKDIKNSSGVTARVVHFDTSAKFGDPYLYVKYVSGASDGSSSAIFSATDILSTVDGDIQFELVSSSGATIVSINNGIFYVNGVFANVNAQTLTLSPTSSSVTEKVGLTVTSSIVTEQDDVALYDNCLGYPNYAAPGAHRFKIDLTLDKKTNDEVISFIDLLHIVEGKIVFENDKTEYAQILRLFARRTYDESGDYEVKPFNIEAKEYRSNNRGTWTTNTPYLVGDIVMSQGDYWEALNDGVSSSSAPSTVGGTIYKHDDGNVKWVFTRSPVKFNNGVETPNVSDTLGTHKNNRNKLSFKVAPGKAYVRGFEVEKSYPSILTTNKSVEYSQISNEKVSGSCGTYITLSSMWGLPKINEYEKINLYSVSPSNVTSGGGSSTATGSFSNNAVTLLTGGYGYSRSSAPIVGFGIGWKPGLSLSLNDVVTTAEGNIYTVTTNHSSSTKPTHTSDTVGNYQWVGTLKTKCEVGLDGKILSIKTFSFTGSHGGGTFFISAPGYMDGLFYEKIGTCRVRSVSTTSAGEYELNVFDVNLAPGYIWSLHVKSFKSTSRNDFYGVVKASYQQLSGSITWNAGSGVFDGVGVDFTKVLTPGQIIQIQGADYQVSHADLTTSTFGVTTSVSNSPSNTQYFACYRNIYAVTSEAVIPLSNKNIRSLRNSDDATWSTSFVVVRQFEQTATNNEISFNLSMPGDAFYNGNGSLIKIVQSDGTPILGPTIIISDDLRTITFTGLTDGITYHVLASIIKTSLASKEKVKTLEVATKTVSAAQAVSGKIVLNHADAFKIISVTQNDVDFTNSYKLDSGVNETSYNLGFITRKVNTPTPTNEAELKITYMYFNHSIGDYLSVNSYTDIPWSGVDENVRDLLDFRPKVDSNGEYVVANGAVLSEVPKKGTSINVSYSFYIPRKDIIQLSSDGALTVVKGVSSSKPSPSSKDEFNITLADVDIAAGVINVSSSSVVINKKEHKRYTMKDIGGLEDRIRNVEYYVELSLLEKDTIEQNIVDENGLDRFKSGVLVDQFKNQGVCDLSNDDFLCTINDTNEYLTPYISQRSVTFTEVNTTAQQRAAKEYQLTGDTISLPYTEVESIAQRVASRTEFVNPFNVVTFNGAMSIAPTSDSWFEKHILPLTNVTTIDMSAQTSAALAATGLLGTRTSSIREFMGTQWGQWDWRTRERTDLFRTTTTSTTTIAAPSHNVQSLGQSFIGSTVAPFIRSRVVAYKAQGLKPFTEYNVEFDGFKDIKCFGSVDIVVTGVTAAFGENVFDISETMKSSPGSTESIYRTPDINLIRAFTDAQNTENIPFNFGSLVYYKSNSSLNTTSLIVVDIVDISATSKMLKCIYIGPGSYTAFTSNAVGKTLYTTFQTMNLGDIVIGTIASVTTGYNGMAPSGRIGKVVTDSLGKTSGFIIPPCFTNGQKITTGEKELQIIEG